MRDICLTRNVLTSASQILILAAMQAAFEKAISVAGGVGALASKLNMGQSRISNWRKSGVPIEATPDIERALDGAVRCEEFFPDVQFDRDATGRVTAYRVRV